MKKLFYRVLVCVLSMWPLIGRAQEQVADIDNYAAETSVFQKIADLEQDKILMQLQKERAQLMLDLDRLDAERAQLSREQENADAKVEQQMAELAKQKQELEKQRQQIEDQKKKMEERPVISANAEPTAAVVEQESKGNISDDYSLREIVGAGSQLFATVESKANGRQKKLAVGKDLDGWTVTSISLDDGVEFQKDGVVSVLTAGGK